MPTDNSPKPRPPHKTTNLPRRKPATSQTAKHRGPTEAAFQAQVITLARLRGWRTAHFRPAQNSRGEWRTPVAGDGKGFPDLVLTRETVLFVELKVGRNALSPEQAAWRTALLNAGAHHYVWRPEDWPEVMRVLLAPLSPP